jgi:hypothetical protein
MTTKLSFYIPVIFCLCFAAALFGQIDSYHLRAKYGPPLARETFTISPGFQIIVDYGPDQQVCRLELPLNQPGLSSRKQADDVLLELVPMSMRGKQLGLGSSMTGAHSAISSAHYEHVVISQSESRVSVSFNREACRNP